MRQLMCLNKHLAIIGSLTSRLLLPVPQRLTEVMEMLLLMISLSLWVYYTNKPNHF